jgi:hypothetical protein
MPSYLIIKNGPRLTVPVEIIYMRSLIEKRLWLHVVTADSFELTSYTATYVTTRKSISGIYSILAAEIVGDKWLLKGLFERCMIDVFHLWYQFGESLLTYIPSLTLLSTVCTNPINPTHDNPAFSIS